eukprot:353093-Chlamydomonas_euryale.AAC.3
MRCEVPVNTSARRTPWRPCHTLRLTIAPLLRAAAALVGRSKALVARHAQQRAPGRSGPGWEGGGGRRHGAWRVLPHTASAPFPIRSRLLLQAGAATQGRCNQACGVPPGQLPHHLSDLLGWPRRGCK